MTKRVLKLLPNYSLFWVKCLVKPFKMGVDALKDVVYCQVIYRNLKLVHVVWDFRPWDVMTKVYDESTLFFRASFSFLGPRDTHSIKIQIDQVFG